MSDEIQVESPIPHYVALKPHTDDPAEPIRYDCSLCDKDVYNLSMHAQFEHGVRRFTVEHDETERDYGVVGHACGVHGCTFDGNHEGRHSWEAVTGDVTESSTPREGILDEDVDGD
jgi:hypothetical protein